MAEGAFLSEQAMSTIEESTKDFFHRHWQNSFGQTPEWSAHWSITSQGPIPNGDKQGCYCLYENSDLVYVGLGVSRGSGLYKEHGIGKRLYSHVVAVDHSRSAENGKGFYKPREKWSAVTHIRTIGFPSGYGYLAPALELFLLNQPLGAQLKNRQKSGSA